MISEELLGMSPEELVDRLRELKDDHTRLRFQKALQQLEGSHRLGQTRRNIARVKTLLRQYDLGLTQRKAE